LPDAESCDSLMEMTMWGWRPRAMVRGALLGTLLISGAVQAQEVTSSRTGFAFTRNRGDNSAEARGRADWPYVTKDQPGTQVHITFDPHNVDVILMTGREFGLSRMIEECQQLAKSVDRPKADFITFLGKKTVSVDVELNDYLVHPSRGRTEAEIDLHALCTALKASKFTRPIVLHVDTESADRVTLSRDGVPRRLRGQAFFGLDELPKDAVLRFESEIPWYAPIIAGGLGVMLLGGLGLTMWMPWRIARQRREQRLLEAAGTPAETPDADAVQKDYNKQPAIWRAFALFPILLLSTALFGDPRRVLESAFYVVPQSVTERGMMYLPVVMLLGMGGSTLASVMVERARARREGLPPVPVDPDEPPAWTRHWFFALLGVIMLVLMGMMVALFSGLPRPAWIIYVPYTALGVMFIGGPVGAWLAMRAVRQELAAGDPWREAVHEIAAQAGVRVRHVVRVQSTSVNAFATVFGTVGLTSALLRRMEADEVRAIIAHELGHLQGGHARRNLVLTLGAAFLALGLWWWLVGLAKGHVSEGGYAILRSPIFSIFVLPMLLNLVLGRGRRRREEAADRFAVEVTGDPELVIRALTRLHTLGETPHQLKPSDEALSTHPSLANRIAAIRKRLTTLPTDDADGRR